ncbi:metal-dependent hydrolase [Candidatus Hydrogenedentota bacterium]
MNPITHFLAGWVVANTAKLEKRDRAMITIAGIIPDVDSFDAFTGLLARNTERPLDLVSAYHHVLAHNVGFAMLVALCASALAKRRRVTVPLVMISFHLHLLADLVGARGPDGYQWPIPYLLPFSNSWQLAWDGQWAFNAWQNLVITAACLAMTLFWAWKRSYSPLELVSKRADKAFVEVLRKRFGDPEE